jgi:hypothetical protein
MKNLIRRQPLGAAALVLSLIALCAALVVPAFAGKKSGKIGTKMLKNGAVTNSKLGDGSVTASKLGKIETVQKTLVIVGGNQFDATVTCPAGTTVISGGAEYVVTVPNADIEIRSSSKEGNGWHVTVFNHLGGVHTYNVEAYCLVA